MKVSLVLSVCSVCSLLFLFETVDYKERFSIQDSWCSEGVCARASPSSVVMSAAGGLRALVMLG